MEPRCLLCQVTNTFWVRQYENNRRSRTSKTGCGIFIGLELQTRKFTTRPFFELVSSSEKRKTRLTDTTYIMGRRVELTVTEGSIGGIEAFLVRPR